MAAMDCDCNMKSKVANVCNSSTMTVAKTVADNKDESSIVVVMSSDFGEQRTTRFPCSSPAICAIRTDSRRTAWELGSIGLNQM